MAEKWYLVLHFLVETLYGNLKKKLMRYSAWN